MSRVLIALNPTMSRRRHRSKYTLRGRDNAFIEMPVFILLKLRDNREENVNEKSSDYKHKTPFLLFRISTSIDSTNTRLHHARVK